MKRLTKLVDGFTFTMPATEENLAAFPHPKTQKKVEFPVNSGRSFKRAMLYARSEIDVEETS